MANSTKNIWSIYCLDEKVTYKVAQRMRPSVCPSDPTHTLSPDVSYTIENDISIPLNQNFETGYYSLKGYRFNCPANQISTHDITFPFNITLLSGLIDINPDNYTDTVSIILTPDLPVGVVVNEAKIGDTTIFVNDTAIDYLIKSSYIKIGEAKYQIKSVNLINSTLILTSPLIADISPFTYILRNYYMVEDVTLCNTSITIGKTNPAPPFIPEGYVIRIIYTNTTDVETKFDLRLEYY